MTTGGVDAGAVQNGSGTAAVAGMDSIDQVVACFVAIGCIGSGFLGKDSWPGTATVVVWA